MWLDTPKECKDNAGDFMSASLAVHYRPNTFEEVCGQTVTVKILKRQLELRQFKNCYLFCGASGCGKTTIARIFANEINNYVGEPIEIDGASNNGVDNVKQIIKSASERALDGKYKIYIIDEAHMLTVQAWNAFLKCIEEPPAYTIFIFCTTDPQKIPATILNRVQRFNFNKIDSFTIKNRLTYICTNEGFNNFADACDYISRTCNGQMRDAIATLEKCAGYSDNLSMENVLAVLGDYSYSTMFSLVNAIIDGNEKTVIRILQDIYNGGSDIKLFINQFLSFVLNIQKYIICGIDVTQFPITVKTELEKSTNFDNSLGFYSYLSNEILSLKNMIKNDVDAITTVNVYMLKMCRLQ